MPALAGMTVFFHPARCQLWMYLANPSLKSRLVW